MIEVSRNSRGVVVLTVSGQIDSEEMRTGLDKFVEVVGDSGPIDILYTITDIGVPTPGAIMVEFGYLPSLFGLMGRMRKVALIANQSWVRSAAKVESAIIPGLTIEVFEPGEEARAEAYLAGVAETV